MKQGIAQLLLLLGVFTISSCTNIYDLEKYQRPEWLEGNLYTQLSTNDQLSQYKRCLELTGYDTIIDKSGSYTIFAPNDEAFSAFLANHPEYGNDVEGIPEEELLKIVKTHIIQDAWTIDQLQSLDINGWINPRDKFNNTPNAYKRESIYQDQNQKYWVKNNQGLITITSPNASSNYRVVHTRSRKYVPIFFPEYFNIAELSAADYEFYFDREYDPSGIQYANAEVEGEEIFAENGIIYEVDEVVEPILNTQQLLDANDNYTYLKELFWLFPDFRIDLTETNKQPEARQGLDFDTLYTLSYPDLPFDIHEELTGPNLNEDRYTLRFHNGVVAPTDQAFEKFFNEILTDRSGYPHWNAWSSVPVEIKKIILRNHMSSNPIYPKDFYDGFYTGENDLISIEPNSINFKYYSSNATFLGVDEVLVPRAFTSVSAPVYLRPGYSNMMYAIESAKLLPTLKQADNDFSFFVIPDKTLNADSSLMFRWKDQRINTYDLFAYDRSEEKMIKMNGQLLRKRLLNQIGLSTPTGSANKEFIENLAGHYIVFNNLTSEVRGAQNTKFGFKGEDEVDMTAAEMAEPTDNGTTYLVNGWMIPATTTLYSALTAEERRDKFLQLLIKAGLYKPASYSFELLSEGENYTIFVPSEEALLAYGADTLSIPDLRQLLNYHFVRGSKIFTDGKMPSKDYSTLRVDESSTELFRKYTAMYIESSADLLEVKNRQGELIGTIPEDESYTNHMIAVKAESDSESDFDYITTTILHDIDFVIHK